MTYFKTISLLIINLLFISLKPLGSKEVAFTEEDRDRLIRLEIMMKEFKESVDKRFEQIDKRFEQQDKRIEDLSEDMNKRFEQVNERVRDLINFLWIMSAVFVTITGLAIGFAFWDRKTILKPLESKAKNIEGELIKNKEKIDLIVELFKNLAKSDKKAEEVLRHFKLL